jgi:hypothetical protein
MHPPCADVSVTMDHQDYTAEAAHSSTAEYADL